MIQAAPVQSSGAGLPDYWTWAVTLASIGSTTVGINVACTIYKLRAPGMSWMRMKLFCWTSLCTAILMIFAMPPLTVATLVLAADRYVGMHFFTNDLGGPLAIMLATLKLRAVSLPDTRLLQCLCKAFRTTPRGSKQSFFEKKDQKTLVN